MDFLFPWLFRLLGRLPLPALHRLGTLAGWLVYLTSASYRQQVQQNLAQALKTAPAPPLLHAAIGEAGKQMLEIAYLWQRPQEEIVQLVTHVSGWELVEAALREKRGILFLTPHLGCFEITAQYVSRFFPITVLFRQPKQSWLTTIMQAGRQRGQIQTAPADASGVRTLLKALRKGEAIGMLPDQAPREGEGLWAPFFGKPAYTMTLAARLSETQAVTLCAWAERLPDGTGYHLRFSPPEPLLAGDTASRAGQINLAMEHLIRQCPAQYLWGYKRYKRPKGAPAPDAQSETA